jgi:DNA-directed RNA polymerase subunit M/transcription elongation factor TFIIS
MSAPTLAVSEEGEECPKCGSFDAGMTWYPAMWKAADASQWPEHVDIKCQRCGFSWSRLPMDAHVK